MVTVQELLHEGDQLPVDEPRRDAEVLLCHCLQKPRTYLYTWPDAAVAEAIAARYRACLQQRLEGQPVAYLTGTREFWSLSLQVNEHTLIPRPETEILVAWALELPAGKQLEVLDLGTGSGAIALALAKERKNWAITAVDTSAGALRCAQANADTLGLENLTLKKSYWFSALGSQRFGLVVSNPPYVADGDPHLSRGDLRFEPRAALVAGADGLGDIRHLVDAAPDFLQQGGQLLIEHGYDQGDVVRMLLADRGFSVVETRQDLSGLDRISGGRWYAG